MNSARNTQRRIRSGLALAQWSALVFQLGGCATHVPQVLPAALVPQQFGQGIAGMERWPPVDWWKTFGSQELSDLIATSQVANRNLAAGAARITEATSQTTIQRSALFPQVNLQAQAQRLPQSAAQTSTSTTSSGSGSQPTSTFTVPLQVSFAADLWGGLHDDVQAAREGVKSARFAQEALSLQVTAGVASTYFSVLALRERTAIVNEDITAITGILDIIKLKVSAGKSSNLDLAQEQAQVEATEAQLPVLQEQELEAMVALAVLVGRPPEAFAVQSRSSEEISPPLLRPGIPSQLLLRRPEVAQAEANLAAGHANLDAARAAFLPQLSLSSSGTYSSTAISTLFHGSNFLWATGANLAQVIFDGGKLIGEKRLAAATQDELIADYQSVVLNAYADVESALGQVINNSTAEDHLRREVESARDAFEIAQLQYRQGTGDLVNLLQAQETLFAARDQQAQTRLARLQALVHLYQALGGGWQEQPTERTQLSFEPRPLGNVGAR